MIIKSCTFKLHVNLKLNFRLSSRKSTNFFAFPQIFSLTLSQVSGDGDGDAGGGGDALADGGEALMLYLVERLLGCRAVQRI